MNLLKEGTPIRQIVFPDDSCITAGRAGTITLTICLEKGQMDFVPWVKEVRSDSVKLHNCAHITSVEFAGPPSN